MGGKNETKSIENIEDCMCVRPGEGVAIIKWSRLIFRFMWGRTAAYLYETNTSMV